MRRALLIALGIDNVGSGLFLPLAIVYVTQVVGLPLATSGTAVALGTAVGVLVPPVAGRMVDRFGPRPVVITSQLLQALGAFGYLAANGVTLVIAGAILLAAGQQTFYSSVFALISDVVEDGPKDRPFAVVAMVRAACFGLGGLAAGGLLTVLGPAAYRAAVAADGLSFLFCAALLALMVRVPHHRSPDGGGHRVLADRPFLALIGIVGLVALATDFLLVGIPVYLLTILHTQPWLPGTILALATLMTSVGGTTAVRLTRNLPRTTTMALAAALIILWCAACLTAAGLPPGFRPAWLLAATVLLSCSGLLFGARANALAVDLAPDAARGRYLAAFQYAFTTAGILAPAVTALFSVTTWLPWLIVATFAAVAMAALRQLAPRLSRHLQQQ